MFFVVLTSFIYFWFIFKFIVYLNLQKIAIFDENFILSIDVKASETLSESVQNRSKQRSFGRTFFLDGAEYR